MAEEIPMRLLETNLDNSLSEEVRTNSNFASNVRRSVTDADVRGRPEQYQKQRHPSQRRVAWSNTVPGHTSGDDAWDPSTIVTDTRQGKVSTASVGDWQHTMALRRRRVLVSDESVDGAPGLVDEYTDAMQHDHKFMANDAEAEMNRRHAFRELTEPLAARKEIKRRLTASTTGRSIKLSSWKSFKYRFNMKFFKAKEHVTDALHDYSLWHGQLKVIEGVFGGGVGTYFRFLRYLIILNFAMSLILCLMLLAPQLIGKHSGFYEWVGNSTYRPVSWNSNNETFLGLDWLTGSGWFLRSELYYGGYANLTVCATSDCINPYDIALAYPSVIIVVFFLYIIVIARRVIKLAEKHTASGVGSVGEGFQMTHILSAWDFSITDERAAKIKHSSIYNEFKALINELEDTTTELSKWQLFKLFMARAFAWTLYFLITGLISWGIYEMQDALLEWFEETTLFGSSDYIVESLALLLSPTALTAVLLFLPLLLELLAKIEKYPIRMEIIITLCRTTFLELIVLGVLLSSWFAPVSNSQDLATEEVLDLCRESLLGAEFYRLAVLNFFVQLLGSVAIVAGSRMCCGKRFAELFSEFSVARNTLHLVYNQTLVWISLFFAPLMPLLAVVKLFFLFQVQKAQVLYAQKPPRRPWRAAQTQTVFFVLTFASLVMCTLATGFIFIRGQGSASCGPLAGMIPYKEIFHTGDDGNQNLFEEILYWLTQPGSVAIIIVCMAIGVYWMRALALGRSELVTLLRHHIELEAKDRAFLLNLSKKMTSGHQCNGLGGASPGWGSRVFCTPQNSVTRPFGSGITRGSFTFSPIEVCEPTSSNAVEETHSTELNDTRPSIPVSFTAGDFDSLSSYDSSSSDSSEDSLLP